MKTVVITGSARGLGLEMSKVFRKNNYNVVISDLKEYRKLSKAERIKEVFEKRLGIVKKSDIATLCPDISETTIERSLKELQESGFIEKIGKGRATGYTKK